MYAYVCIVNLVINHIYLTCFTEECAEAVIMAVQLIRNLAVRVDTMLKTVQFPK